MPRVALVSDTRYHGDSLSWIGRTRELGLWFHDVPRVFSDWWFGTMEFTTFHILGIVTPTDELHHFSEG